MDCVCAFVCVCIPPYRKEARVSDGADTGVEVLQVAGDLARIERVRQASLVPNQDVDLATVSIVPSPT